MAMRTRTIGALALPGALVVTIALAVTPSAHPFGSGGEVSRPHALKLLINGKNWPLNTLNGSDDYLPIRAGRLRVQARWRTDARGTGYYVLISSTEPVNRNYARCFTGTSCLVPRRVPISVNQEMTLTVKVLTTNRNRLVAGFKACLIGGP
jgi:hypothetical protein